MGEPVEGILTIPEEVMYGHIFPFLKFTDVLRLRKVCQQIKLFVDAYIRLNCNEAEREINETDHTIAEYIRRNLPTSKVFINNSGPGFFEDPSIPEFLQLYADKITHLKVAYFSTCISDAENKFFLALTNLQHLELDYTDARGRRLGYDFTTSKEKAGVKIPRAKCYFPATFKNLKTLKFGEITGSEPIDTNYAWDFVDFSTKLEYLKHPLYPKSLEAEGTFLSREGPLARILVSFELRILANPEDPITLKYYDIQHHNDNDHYTFAFAKLLRRCEEDNFKLLNVDAALYRMAPDLFEDSYHQFADPIVSVRNLHGNMFLTEFQNLEKVVVISTAKSSYAPMWSESQPNWPKLTSLDVTIDSDETLQTREFVGMPVTDLLEFLFGSVERKKLVDLRIAFARDPRTRRFAFPCPRAADIANSCKNVTRLTLSNWIGTNKAVSKFWSGLPLLEEVVLEECRMLGDVAFVGKDREDPAFLKLKNLRKLALKGLDSMTKITDLIFNLVFQHLSIKEFCLTSKEPVKSVTSTGIRTLLTGEFNKSVEKFPFQGWSLEKVSAEEYSKLEKEFRASYMI